METVSRELLPTTVVTGNELLTAIQTQQRLTASKTTIPKLLAETLEKTRDLIDQVCGEELVLDKVACNRITEPNREGETVDQAMNRRRYLKAISCSVVVREAMARRMMNNDEVIRPDIDDVVHCLAASRITNEHITPVFIRFTWAVQTALSLGLLEWWKVRKNTDTGKIVSSPHTMLMEMASLLEGTGEFYVRGKWASASYRVRDIIIANAIAIFNNESESIKTIHINDLTGGAATTTVTFPEEPLLRGNQANHKFVPSLEKVNLGANGVIFLEPALDDIHVIQNIIKGRQVDVPNVNCFVHDPNGMSFAATVNKHEMTEEVRFGYCSTSRVDTPASRKRGYEGRMGNVLSGHPALQASVMNSSSCQLGTLMEYGDHSCPQQFLASCSVHDPLGKVDELFHMGISLSSVVQRWITLQRAFLGDERNISSHASSSNHVGMNHNLPDELSFDENCVFDCYPDRQNDSI